MYSQLIISVQQPTQDVVDWNFKTLDGVALCTQVYSVCLKIGLACGDYIFLSYFHLQDGCNSVLDFVFLQMISLPHLVFSERTNAFDFIFSEIEKIFVIG